MTFLLQSNAQVPGRHLPIGKLRIDDRGQRAFRRNGSTRSMPRGFDLSCLAIPVRHQMVKKNDHVFATPDVIAQKLGRRFQRRAMPFRGVSAIHTSFAERLISKLGVPGSNTEKIAVVSIAAFRDHNSGREFCVEEKMRLFGARILQMPCSFRLAVFPIDLDQIPGIDRRIEVHEGDNAIVCMNGTCLPKLLEVEDRQRGYKK